MKKLITEKEEFKKDFAEKEAEVPKKFEEKNAEAMGGIMAIFNMLQKGDK